MRCPQCNTPNEDHATTCRSCGAPLRPGPAPDSPDSLPVGTKLQGGNFTLGKVLGQGGFGITYIGSDTGLRRAVAVKEFFPSGCIRHANLVQPAGAFSGGNYQAARETFLDEARTLAQFQHPNIVDVYTVFEENNTAYMVMEYLRGKTLMQVIEERGPLAESEAIAYVRQIGIALEVVHGAGLLHQDIKPDNAIIHHEGRVVLLDFGLTKRIETPRSYGTVRFTGHTRFGTPGYAPLEQYGRQARVGIYTDVYALAATLYHLLTGQAPPEATDRAAGVELPDVLLANPEVSVATADAVAAGLAMEVENRPQSVREFLALLDGREHPGTVPVSMPTPPRPAPPDPVYVDELDTPSQYEPEPPPTYRDPYVEPDPPQTYSRQADPSYPTYPTVNPARGCMRGIGCVTGCVVSVIMFILWLLAQLFGGFYFVGF